jgi:hypothetical protein
LLFLAKTRSVRTLQKWRLVQESRFTILDRSPRCPRALEGRVRTRSSTLDSIEEEIGHS